MKLRPLFLALVEMIGVLLVSQFVYYFAITRVRVQFRGQSGEGVTAIVINDRWGYMDERGDIIVPPRFDWTGAFHEGLGAFAMNKKYGFIDKTGTIRVEPRFKRVGIFSDGVAPVEIDHKWGYIDHAGAFTIAPQYEWASPFSEGLASASNHDGSGYIDKTGAFVIAPQNYRETGDFSEGLATIGVITKIAPTQLERKYGYIDRSGKIVIQPQFAIAFAFKEGYAVVRKMEPFDWYYIDKKGNFVEGPQKNWRKLKKPQNIEYNQIPQTTNTTSSAPNY